MEMTTEAVSEDDAPAPVVLDVSLNSSGWTATLTKATLTSKLVWHENNEIDVVATNDETWASAPAPVSLGGDVESNGGENRDTKVNAGNKEAAEPVPIRLSGLILATKADNADALPTVPLLGPAVEVKDTTIIKTFDAYEVQRIDAGHNEDDTAVATVRLSISIWAPQTESDNSIAAATTFISQEVSTMIRDTLNVTGTLEDEVVIQVKDTALEPTASI